jgi:hypothetical protein
MSYYMANPKGIVGYGAAKAVEFAAYLLHKRDQGKAKKQGTRSLQKKGQEVWR